MPSDTRAMLTEKQRYWLGHIQQARHDKQSFSAYAQQHALDLKALYNHHWLLRKRGLLDAPVHLSQFIKVTAPVKQTPSVPVSMVILRFPNGIRLEVPASAADLRSLIKQVQSL